MPGRSPFLAISSIVDKPGRFRHLKSKIYALSTSPGTQNAEVRNTRSQRMYVCLYRPSKHKRQLVLYDSSLLDLYSFPAFTLCEVRSQTSNVVAPPFPDTLLLWMRAVSFQYMYVIPDFSEQSHESVCRLLHAHGYPTRVGELRGMHRSF